jgi:hypothetical protein
MGARKELSLVERTAYVFRLNMMTPRLNASPWLRFFPVLLYLVLSSVYLYAIPVGESPDEPGHIQCIEQVSRYSRLPVVEPKPKGEWWSRDVIISGRMCYHMPLYYLLGGYTQKIIGSITNSSLHYEFPPSNPEFIGSGIMFLHEDKLNFSEMPEPLTIIGLRILSVGLGAIVLWAVYRVAVRIFPNNEYIAILSMTIAACWPQFIFLSRSINNDSLATALAVIVLVVLLNAKRPYRIVGAAILSALAVLTKLSVSFTVGVVLVVWLTEFIILRQPKTKYIVVFVASIIIWGGTGLFILSNPIINLHFNQSLNQFSAISNQVWTLSYWSDVFQLTLSSGWAKLGWMSISVPQWHAYVWWSLVSILVLIGVRKVFHLQKTKEHQVNLFILLIWVVAILLAYFRININRLQPQFRFAMAILPIIATMMGAGLLAYFQDHRSKTIISVIVLTAVLLCTYNLWLVFSIIGPTYGWSL